jgi:hypothetical protein
MVHLRHLFAPSVDRQIAPGLYIDINVAGNPADVVIAIPTRTLFGATSDTEMLCERDI